MKYFLQQTKRDAFAFCKARLTLVVMLLLFTPLLASAKSAMLRGVVTGVDKQPLIGATVLVKGTQIGTVTDVDGGYVLKLPSATTDVITVSYIGFQTQELPVNNRTEINVVLNDDTATIDAVVVVGYGVQKKESVVGAISQVEGESLVKSGTANVSNAIAGRLSGVLTIQDSGQPGENTSSILIRGVSSWNGSSPLCLVDGVERSFEDMDPNEIETFSVLKDASATAVFGAKGANGVIIVTTKRGKKGAPKLNASVSYGMSTPSVDIGYVDAYTTQSMRNEGLKTTGNYSELRPAAELDKYRNPTSILDEVLYPDVNWFDLLTKNFASELNANVSLSGGTEAVKYFVSVGYNHEGSIFKTYKTDEIDTSFKNDRINYRTNFDFKLSKTTDLKFNVGGATVIYNAPTAANGTTGNYLWDAIFTQSASKYPAFYPKELLEQFPDFDYPDDDDDRLIKGPETRDSPYSYLMQAQFEQLTTSSLYTDLALNQKLDFVTKGLSFGAKVSVNTNYKRESLKANKKFAQYTFNIDSFYAGSNPWFREGATNNDIYTEPELNMAVGDLKSFKLDLYYEASLNYNRTFNDDHTVSALALFNRSQKQSGADFPYYNESWVARATYDYQHKYLAEINLGYTGSEKFAPTKRFGFFPSFALGYVVSNEKWFKDNVRWMDKLKFRYSDGRVGSDSGDRWLYVSEYLQSNNMIYDGAVANLGAQWEEAHKRDFGVEMGFLDNALTLHVDLFDELRTNMLVDPSTSTGDMFGGNGFKEMNLGSMKKHGLEVESAYRGKTKFGLRYGVNAMFSFVENRIIAKNDIAGLPSYQKAEGTAFGSQKGSVTTGSGFYTSIDDIHNYTNQSGLTLDKMTPGTYRYVDYNGDAAINTSFDTYPIEGSKYAPITYSFGGNLNYKNFTFSVLFQGCFGKYVTFSGSFKQEFNGDDWRVQENMLDSWSPTNQDAAFHAIRAYNSGTDALGSTDGISWISADYLKLRDVYLGYKFDTKALKSKIGLSNLTVYVTGNNLVTFSDFIFYDPESPNFSSGGYPQMRTVKLGVKLGF